MGLLRRRRLQWGPSAAARRPSTDDIEQARGPSATVRTALGSCHLGDCTIEKFLLRKYPWEVTDWEKSQKKITKKHCFKTIVFVFFVAYNMSLLKI